ncbi:uncharacterized protein KY384_003896 [Bacidia gigantensis]|uniref:uncharacterized protein n=1 Tax=Bacidia gigantensis TaxID=2732470 RepID=UPI001D036D57|nr:uncharacterized protein KY384_003896 [Bacidia gigantensis]KAG8532255.1 hypothetical protein KY384_003896 [Bacidia gigantensis]
MPDPAESPSPAIFPQDDDPLPSPPPGGFPPDSPRIAPEPVSQPSLTEAVWDRRADYTIPRKVQIKIGTWNVASLNHTDKDIGKWFTGAQAEGEIAAPKEAPEQKHGYIESIKKAVHLEKSSDVAHEEEIGLYALGLQEIVDISSAAELLKPYVDPHPAQKWKQAVAKALPGNYHLVAEQQLLGLYVIIYASTAMLPLISNVSVNSTATGGMGWMGNKGAVAVRLVLGQTTKVVFVNCHLSAGVEKGNLERRNWDVSQIVSRTKFTALEYGIHEVEGRQEHIGDEDFCFWFGDLNYRLEGIPGEDVRRLLMLHTHHQSLSTSELSDVTAKVAYSKPVSQGTTVADPETDNGSSQQPHDSGDANLSTVSSLTLVDNENTPAEVTIDPTSMQSTVSSLLSHDQLRSQMKAEQTLYDGWREGDIHFLPTYKYDLGTLGSFDSSEKKRSPSWCDRILFRSKEDRLAYETKASERVEREQAAGKSQSNSDKDESVIFDYDPETDGMAYGDDPSRETQTPKSSDTIKGSLEQNTYRSHQDILSSDHKPLDALFSLYFDAVDEEKKAQLRGQMAKEFDREENERRPTVSITAEDTNEVIESIDFGQIHYEEPEVRKVMIANTGISTATIQILKGPSPDTSASPWLTIHYDESSDDHPQDHVLRPGEKISVKTTIHVTAFDQVQSLNNGDQSLEDVMILRVIDGRDYFLPIAGHWAGSYFGRSLTASDDSTIGSRAGAVPRSISSLAQSLDGLVERAVADMAMKEEKGPWETEPRWPFKGHTKAPGQRREIQYHIRRNLERNAALTTGVPEEADIVVQVEAMAEVILSFLESLEDGVIPKDLWEELDRDMGSRSKFQTKEEEQSLMIDILAKWPRHCAALTTITFMLAKVAHEIAPPPAERHGKALSAYTHIFSDVLFRYDGMQHSKKRKYTERHRIHLLETFM